MCLNIAKLPLIEEPVIEIKLGVSKYSKVTMDGRTCHRIQFGCLNMAKLPWMEEPLIASIKVCLNIGKFSWMEEPVIEIKLAVSKYSKINMDGRTCHRDQAR